LVKQATKILVAVSLTALFTSCSSHSSSMTSASPVETKKQEITQQSQQPTAQADNKQQQPTASQPSGSQAAKSENSKEEKNPTSPSVTEVKQPTPTEITQTQGSDSAGKAETIAPLAPPASAVKATESEKSTPSQTVSLSIVGDKEHGVILSAQSVPIEQGDTVLDVLSRVVKGKKIQMEYSGVKATAYVKGIDNLYEFDDGPKSGWMVKVNGKAADRSAGNYPVKAGDRIEWLYTLDLGKDIGAK
jgi:hypothetical protein